LVFDSYLHLVFCILYLATMNCLLIGNYGVANLGDEALRQYFLDTFPEVEWLVVSAHPSANEYARLPFGIRSLFRSNWLRTLAAYRQVDAVVFGGGSLWTDVESVKACFLWSLHACAARLYGKKIILAFQGVGPFRTRVGERLARAVVRRAAFISVRDRASAERLKKWGMDTKFVQTFDPIFSAMEKQKMNSTAKNVCSIIPRGNSSEKLMETALSYLRMTPHIHHLNILLMQPDHPGEQAMAVRLERELGLPASIIAVRTLSDLMKGVGDGIMVISERFHGALAALAAGVEVQIVSQGSGDKLAELSDLVDHGFNAETADELIAAGEAALRTALQR
jgi:polysaccharide pyruvyl transferase CsaB